MRTIKSSRDILLYYRSSSHLKDGQKLDWDDIDSAYIVHRNDRTTPVRRPEWNLVFFVIIIDNNSIKCYNAIKGGN